MVPISPFVINRHFAEQYVSESPSTDLSTSPPDSDGRQLRAHEQGSRKDHVDKQPTVKDSLSLGGYIDANNYGKPSVSAPRPIVRQSATASPEVQTYINNLAQVFQSPAQKTSNIIAGKMRTKWGLDINPDKTRIVTLNYDLSKPRPATGKVLNEMTLTEAALNNVRGINKQDQTPSAGTLAELAIIHQSEHFPMITPFSLLGKYEQIKGALSPTFEYILRPPKTAASSAYAPSLALSQTPGEFRDLVWDTQLIEPYKRYLDGFWPAHQHSYTQLSRVGFAQAAFVQAQEGSLNQKDVALVMTVAGLDAGKAWLDVTIDDLNMPYARDTNPEVGMLTINGDQSTDLMYVLDKNPTLNAQGKSVHTTLLYIPGNSSPIHRFDSPQEMKRWLADQAANPVKKAALLTHFMKNDQDAKVFSDGVQQSLTGLGGWSESQKPNALGFTGLNSWDPQRYITLQPTPGNPFEAMTERQKLRAYADADHDIRTDGDVTKASLLKASEAATAAALMMTPLALVMPEVALALDAVYLGTGLVQAGIGIDDLAHGKSTASDRIVFGVLNAAPSLLHGASSVSAAQASEAQVISTARLKKPIVMEMPEVFGGDGASRGVQRITLDAQGRDLNKINDLIFTYVDTYKGADRLNIVAHGRPLSFLEKRLGLPTEMVVNDEKYDASQLLDLLWDNDVAPETFENVRLLMCNAGVGNERSFAAQFQEFIERPVKAYAGPVSVEFNMDQLEDLFDPRLRADNRVIQIEGKLPKTRSHNVVKVNPYSSDPSSDEYKKYLNFAHKPVHFPPRLSRPESPQTIM